MRRRAHAVLAAAARARDSQRTMTCGLVRSSVGRLSLPGGCLERVPGVDQPRGSRSEPGSHHSQPAGREQNEAHWIGPENSRERLGGEEDEGAR